MADYNTLFARERDKRTSVVNVEGDLGLAPNSVVAAAANAQKLNAHLAAPATHTRELFFPRKRYYIDAKIVVPAYAGAVSMFGGGTLGNAVSQVAEAARFAPISTLCWVGATRSEDHESTMLEVLSERCQIRGLRFEGARVPSGGIEGFPIEDDRVAVMLSLRHPNNDEVPGGGGAADVHSGKCIVENCQFNFGNVGISLGYDEVETHVDECRFAQLHFDVVGTYFLIDNLQSIANRFDGIIGYSNRLGGSAAYAPTTAFDVRRGGMQTITNLTFNTAGGTVFKFGHIDESSGDDVGHIKRPITSVLVNGLWVDASMTTNGHTLDHDFKLVDTISKVGNSVGYALKIDGGSLSCNWPTEDLLSPNINARTALATLSSSPAGTFTLKARRSNMPTSIEVDQGAAGVVLSGGVLTVSLDISGGANTVQHVANVIAAASTNYRVSNVTNGSSTITGSTSGTVALTALDAPIVTTRGTDCTVQLGVWNVDEITQAKYPLLARMPSRTAPEYAGAFHLPTALSARVMPDIAPSASVADTLDGALIWLEAEFLTAVDLDSGKVKDWPDHSSSNNNLMQGTAGDRPIYKPQFTNHRPAAHFRNTGGGDWLEFVTPTSDFHALTDFTVYAVFSLDALTGAIHTVCGVFNQDDNDRSWRLRVNTDGTVALATSANGIPEDASTGVGPLLRYTPNLVACSRNSSSGVITTIANGVYGQTTDLPTGATADDSTEAPGAAFQVSGHIVSASRVQPLQGALSALIIIPSATINDDILNYLRAKWGCN